MVVAYQVVNDGRWPGGPAVDGGGCTRSGTPYRVRPLNAETQEVWKPDDVIALVVRRHLSEGVEFRNAQMLMLFCSVVAGDNQLCSTETRWNSSSRFEQYAASLGNDSKRMTTTTL